MSLVKGRRVVLGRGAARGRRGEVVGDVSERVTRQLSSTLDQAAPLRLTTGRSDQQSPKRGSCLAQGIFEVVG